MIAEIIINTTVKDLNRTFDYIIPEKLEENITIGSKVFVPFGKGDKIKDGYIINIKEISKFANKEIISIQEDGLTVQNMELAKIMAKRYFCNISDCIKLMLPPGSLAEKTKNRPKEKIGNFVYLKKDIEEIENKKIKSPKQIELLQFLKDNEGVYLPDLQIMTNTSKTIIKTLEKNEYIEIIEEQIQRNPFENKQVKRDSKLSLTKEQQGAFNYISDKIKKDEFEEILLYGVTGSGKTEVYLQLIETALNEGKRAIMLVPEISLTPQMVDRFLARFGDCIAVLHSKLSIGERYDEWNKIKKGKCKIVIGARSAIFAPVENLGIIIIDEEHDQSYKSDKTPKYSAKDIAKYICKKNSIPLLLGSATPDINTFYKASTNKIKMCKLTKRANSSNLPDVEIVDLRKELASGNKSMISVQLYNEIQKNLTAKRQTILFLNRRGYSTFVMCRECGYTINCKNCNITLTYHINENKLKCHYCGYETKSIKVCPNCKSNKIKYFGAGTQKLENEIKKIFKDASTIRMDVDTVTKKNSHEKILSKFKNENIDILIGTQMVVKGHHFPNVTLVGVIVADSSLNIDDFRASERTFQILTQVAGRAGRENLPGKVIIQTYNPENYSIICAKKQDYDLFYKDEIKIREQLKYPPFFDIIVFAIGSSDEDKVKLVSDEIYKKFKYMLKNQEINLTVLKPMPSPINKINNKYRWRIIAKGKINTRIVELINVLLQEMYKKERKNVTITVDINPNSMM